MSTSVASGSVTLTEPAEPAEVRAQLAEIARDDPARAQKALGAPGWVADELWQDWGSELGGAGLDRAGFDAVIAGYERELWLWVVGERTWTHCADGLAGRLRRRVPGAG